MDIFHSINLKITSSLNLETYYKQAQRFKQNNKKIVHTNESCKYKSTDKNPSTEELKEPKFITPIANVNGEYEENLSIDDDNDNIYDDEFFDYNLNIACFKNNDMCKCSHCTYDINVLNALHKSVMYEGNIEAGKELFQILPSKMLQAHMTGNTYMQSKLNQITNNTIRMFQRNHILGYLHIANFYLKTSSNIHNFSNSVDILNVNLFKEACAIMIGINKVFHHISIELEEDNEVFNFVFKGETNREYKQIISDGDKWIVNPDFLEILNNAINNENIGECIDNKMHILRLYGFREYMDYVIYSIQSSAKRWQEYVT